MEQTIDQEKPVIIEEKSNDVINKEKHKEETQWNWIVAYNILIHILMYGYTIYLSYFSLKGSLRWFSWHIPFSVLGYSILMSESMLCFSPTNFLTNKLNYKKKILIHWILQVAAVFFILAGLLVVFIPTQQYGGDHFESWHDKFGWLAYLFTIFALAGGIPTFYNYKLRFYIKPVWMKIIHSIIGLLAFILAIVCIIFGYYTRWFLYWATPTEIYCCLICTIVSSQYIVYGPMVTLIGRIKDLMNTNNDE